LSNRLKINSYNNVQFIEELDFFGNYLREGLYYEETEELKDVDVVQFMSYTTEIDNWYFFERGLRESPTQKPTQKMPPAFRQIIDDLESKTDVAAHTEAIFALLEWDFSVREQIALHFATIRETTSSDKQIHDFSMGANSKQGGITIVSCVRAEVQEAYWKLFYVCRSRVLGDYASWLGLLTIVDESGLIHGFFVPDPGKLGVSSHFDPQNEN